MGGAVKRALAKWRWLGVPLVWDADDGPQEAPPALVVHIHVHAPAGIGQAARIIQATPERAAITGGEAGMPTARRRGIR
jgi:hypothetical protein